MASKIIGVEIGSDSVKLAVCSGGKVKAMAAARMPEGMVQEGRITTPSAMTVFLKELLKENNIKPGPCALVLPPEIVLAHRVTMPVMSEKELLLNLPFEFRDFVGKDSAKYDYDYITLDSNGKTMNLYAAAVRRDIVQEYDDILARAGLILKAAMPYEMAWLNLIRKCDNVPDSLCIIDCGYRTTRVSVYSKGKYEMGRDVELAGQVFDQAIADDQQIDTYAARVRKENNMDNVLVSDPCNNAYQSLAVEIMRVVNYYRGNAEDGRLEDLYYCGGSSRIDPLRTAILKRTDGTMHHIRRLLDAQDLEDERIAFCAIAAGAAMQLQ